MKLKATMNTDNHEASGKDSTRNWTSRPAFYIPPRPQRHGSKEKPTSEVDILCGKTWALWERWRSWIFQSCVANWWWIVQIELRKMRGTQGWTGKIKIYPSPVVIRDFFSLVGWSSWSCTVTGREANVRTGFRWWGDACCCNISDCGIVWESEERDTLGDVESRGGEIGSLLTLPMSAKFSVLKNKKKTKTFLG